MAVAFESPVLTNGTDAGTASSYTTGSFSPTAGRLVCIAIVVVDNTSPVTPTLTGNSITWVFVDRADHDTGGQQASVFLFIADAVSPSSGTLVMDFAGTDQGGVSWVVAEFSGADNANANVQSDTAIAFGLSVAAALAAFGAGNATIIAMAYDEDDQTIIPTSPMVLILNEENTTDNDTVGMAFFNADDTTPAFTISPNDENMGIVAMEIKVAGGAPAGEEVLHRPKLIESLLKGHLVGSYD